MPESIFNSIDSELLEIIQSLTLMDDNFMTVVFGGDKKLTELLLKILLGRDDLKIKRSMTQKEIKNLFGRSVKLDIIAEDMNKKQYNIEIQRDDEGASGRRIRYNAALLDSHTLRKSKKVSELPEQYIIFITENDYLGYGKPVYKVHKIFDVKSKDGKDLIFDDGCNIMYVNGAYRGEDPIGWLMHDLATADADKMHYNLIADSVRLHKQNVEEEKSMGRPLEEWANRKVEKAVLEKTYETARNFYRNGASLELISKSLNLSEEKVQEIINKTA